MRDRLDDLGTNTDVVLITFTEPDRLAHYQSVNELPFPILIDRHRDAYRSFGLGRGAITRVWGLKSLRRYAAILRRSGAAALRVPTEDTLQLGGDFVIGPDGTLVWGHWSDGPDDRPTVGDLIAVIEPLAS